MKKILSGAVAVGSLIALGAPAWAQCNNCPQPVTENYTYQETVPQQQWIVPAHTQTVPAYKVGGAPTGNMVSNCPYTNMGGYSTTAGVAGAAPLASGVPAAALATTGASGFGTGGYPVLSNLTNALYGTAQGVVRAPRVR
ncbi:MAG: hypothetical protein PHW76_09705 [Alphaproteobacteria bacterium]|nr:hypothetical protein [Alphaproteobacteria bacterium]